MPYTTGEVAKKLGLTKDGLRYYEKEGLLPPIKRNQSDHRTYTESDVEWIFLIRCLRDTDMPIAKIKQYVALLMQEGNDSIKERRAILKDHQAYINEKRVIYDRLSLLIDKKLSFYDDALTAETKEKCMDYADEWAHFRSLLGGIKHD